MSTPLRVLIVEDSEDDASLLIRALKSGGYEPSYERVDTPEAMSAALSERAWDLIISDYVMPRFSGLNALKMAQAMRNDIPFIMVSGKTGEDIAVEAMKAGAHDYIMKDRLVRIVPAIERELREAAARRERRHVEEEKRRFYRETILSATDGKLVICDPVDIDYYASQPSVCTDVRKPNELSEAVENVRCECRKFGLDEESTWGFSVGVGEAITNALKHASGGHVCMGKIDNDLWVAVADHGSGINSLILPAAVLRRGFSTKPSMGLGYAIMLDVSDRILLNTGAEGTTIVLIKDLSKHILDLHTVPDTWSNIPGLTT
jgi:CheY-like chemotaxis protein/anti-sigma regulatory factor (Ser/Thr protein kinase)